MIADSGGQVPFPPLCQGLLEIVQKSTDFVRGSMEENVKQSLFVMHAERQVCKYVDD
jgi:hypothetical protein